MRRSVILITLLVFNFFIFYGIKEFNKVIIDNDMMVYFKEKPVVIETEKVEFLDVVVEEYNKEKIENIIAKMDKYFNKTPLEGYGEYIVKTAAYKGVDPYLIGGIILESTTCKYDCTILFKECNNVYMEKGEPGCFGGSYKKYDKIDDSILDLVLNIRKNFEDSKEQTPVKIYKHFNKNSSWAFKVNKYIEILKRVK